MLLSIILFLIAVSPCAAIPFVLTPTTSREQARILRDKLSRRLTGAEIELASAIADGHALDTKHWREFVKLCDEHKDAIAMQANHEPDLEGRELLGAALAGKGGRA